MMVVTIGKLTNVINAIQCPAISDSNAKTWDTFTNVIQLAFGGVLRTNCAYADRIHMDSPLPLVTHSSPGILEAARIQATLGAVVSEWRSYGRGRDKVPLHVVVAHSGLSWMQWTSCVAISRR